MTQYGPRLPEMPDYDDMRKGRFLIGNMICCLAVIFFFIFAVNWMMSDITGEYSAEARGMTVTISLIRRPASLWGELVGAGAAYQLVNTDSPTEEMVNLIFEPKNTVGNKPQKLKQISFVGTIKDGVMEGEFVTAGKRFPVRLTRLGINSIYRQIQSHLPFIEVD